MVASSAIAIKEFALALHGKRPLSRIQLQEVTGLANSTITQYLKLFRAAKLVYVKDYTRQSDRGQWIELFAWGYMMPDADKPRPLTNKEYCETYRRKKVMGKRVTKTEKGLIHVAD